MKEIIEDKGRIRPVVEGDFQCDENGNSTRVYEILSIVGLVDGNTKLSYISKKFVPVGIPITNSEYWYSLQVIAVPKGDKGDKGDDGVSPIFRVSPDGMSIETSNDNGQTWVPFITDFNKLRVIGYVDSINQLPVNAQLGDIYGVWNASAAEGDGAYELYINTIKRWDKDKDIDKVYEYDSELPSSATDGTVVLIPVTNDKTKPIDGSSATSTTEWQDGDEVLDKKRVDGYKVYKYNADARSWSMILNTGEIFAAATDIINHGDNVYGLVQGATAGTYELYKRQTGWVYFGTNASITYHLVQNVEDGTEQNVLSGKAVKDALAAERARAEASEQELENAIGVEEARATAAEEANANNIAVEISRATEAEQVNANAIAAETTRAEAEEQTLETAINVERTRATEAETALSSRITQETERATGVEGGIRSDLTNEISRATEAETTNAQDIITERNRAIGAETANSNAITSETERAISAEQVNAQAIQNEANTREQAILSEQSRAVEAEQSLSGNITTLRSYVDTEFTELDGRLDALEQGNLKLTLTASPNKTFEKGIAEDIRLTASLDSITPTTLDIKLGNTKLNDGNNNTAVYSSALTDNSTVFTAKATYYDATINTSLTLQARYPIYYGFGQDAAAVALIEASIRIVATSAARTYTRTSAATGYFFIIVPPDVSALNTFTMNGAPFVMDASTTTINGVAGYRVYKSGVKYAASTAISVVAS